MSLKEGTIVITQDGKKFRLGPLHGHPNDIHACRLIPVDPHPLKPRGDAERHRLVAARLNLREDQHA